MEDARQPTAAERVRTLVESSVSARLRIPGAEHLPEDPLGGSAPLRRAVTPDGDVLVQVTADAPAARAAAHAQHDDLTAVMELTDVAPVAVPHRVRGQAWVAGWLTAVPGTDHARCAGLLSRGQPEGPEVHGPQVLLRLEVGEARVDDLWGEEHVEPEEFAAAAPDPLARHEAELLQHLAAAHGDRVRGLCSLLGDDGEELCGAWDRVAPLSLDRYGMRLRFAGPGRCFDARFEFPEPVGDLTALRRAMHRLFEAAGS
ncbi:DUF2470 domain-containing protein [Streptomyces sp. JJ36]|nr:DUF2470 domain-containing protein [Streptomyces sp. JJ36]